MILVFIVTPPLILLLYSSQPVAKCNKDFS
jgi:hypothetical protein